MMPDERIGNRANDPRTFRAKTLFKLVLEKNDIGCAVAVVFVGHAMVGHATHNSA
ncbi:hypothetical protein D3C76_1757500 [compost metagenome]